MKDTERKVKGVIDTLMTLVESGGSVGLCLHKTTNGQKFAAYTINEETGEIFRFEHSDPDAFYRWVRARVDKRPILRLREDDYD